MSSFIRNLPVYRPNGQPAFGWVQLPQTVLTGDNVVINGDTYTFGTDFFGASAAQQLRSLVNAIRANQNDAAEVAPGNTGFFRAYTAEFSGKYAVVFATSPGASGNAITLTTNAGPRILVSGATLSGGASPAEDPGMTPVYGSTPVDAASLALVAAATSQTVFAANAARRYLIIQNLSADELWVNFGAAATEDKPSLALAPAVGMTPGGSIEYAGTYVPNSSVTIIGATLGSKFSAKQG